MAVEGLGAATHPLSWHHARPAGARGWLSICARSNQCWACAGSAGMARPCNASNPNSHAASAGVRSPVDRVVGAGGARLARRHPIALRGAAKFLQHLLLHGVVRPGHLGGRGVQAGAIDVGDFRGRGKRPHRSLRRSSSHHRHYQARCTRGLRHCAMDGAPYALRCVYPTKGGIRARRGRRGGGHRVRLRSAFPTVFHLRGAGCAGALAAAGRARRGMTCQYTALPV